jgi:hypothetical protein
MGEQMRERSDIEQFASYFGCNYQVISIGKMILIAAAGQFIELQKVDQLLKPAPSCSAPHSVPTSHGQLDCYDR